MGEGTLRGIASSDIPSPVGAATMFPRLSSSLASVLGAIAGEETLSEDNSDVEELTLVSSKRDETEMGYSVMGGLETQLGLALAW